MLIEENVVDFIQLLTNQGYFNMKVREAYILLMQSQQQQPLNPGLVQ
jgi:hypothetical protein